MKSFTSVLTAFGLIAAVAADGYYSNDTVVTLTTDIYTTVSYSISLIMIT
jgi:hypothetical protein